MNELPGDATRVAFPNSGLVLFVYDDANADAIRTANPSILEGFGEDDISDPALARLGAEGLLVVVELEQDDYVRLQLAVRDPLSDEERGDDWGPSDRAMISLPSGTLKIEGYDNLRIAPDVFEDAEPGGTVHVPPGRYALSFYWRPLEAAEAVSAESPRHLIILTHADDAASASSGAAFLTPVPRQA